MSFSILDRWKKSLSKRIYWRSHLRDAVNSVKEFKTKPANIEQTIDYVFNFRGEGYYETLDLKQNASEIISFSNFLKNLKLHYVCEIGTNKGGSLFIWCQVAADDANLFSIDLPGGKFGGGYAKRNIPYFESFCKKNQSLTCLRMNSQEEYTLDILKKKLRGEKLDFLFIDGDHRYEGVKKDYELYSQLVRKGGIIAFHDILERPEEPEIQVPRLWGEVKTTNEYKEFIDFDENAKRVGIGLIIKQ
jgi:predicted O-methyltransferase YrrM